MAIWKRRQQAKLCWLEFQSRVHALSMWRPGRLDQVIFSFYCCGLNGIKVVIGLPCVYLVNMIKCRLIILIIVFWLRFSIRCQGSAALNMCGVASGHTDAYYEFGPHIWDYAAAHLIAMEAGATVTSPNGELSHIISPSLSSLKYNPYCMCWSCSPSALLCHRERPAAWPVKREQNYCRQYGSWEIIYFLVSATHCWCGLKILVFFKDCFPSAHHSAVGSVVNLQSLSLSSTR